MWRDGVGVVYGCGSNDHRMLGFPDHQNYELPAILSIDFKVTDIAVGISHSLLLDGKPRIIFGLILI